MSATATDRSSETRRGYLMVFLAASLWGLIGVFSRKVGDQGLEPLEIAFWRAALSGALFGLHARRSRAGWLPRRELPKVFAFALVGVALFYGSLNVAIDAGGLSLASVLLYSAPAFVTLIAWPLLGERPTGRKVALVALVFVGVALVAGGAGDGIVVSARSVGFGLLSGFTYSSFYWQAWGWLAALVALSTYGAYLAYGLGVQRVDASSAILVATIEPVISLALAAALFGERFGIAGAVGSVCVISAALLAALPARSNFVSPPLSA